MFSRFEFTLFGRREEEHARDILNSIATRGLRAPKSMSLRGSLKFDSPTTQLCYNRVELMDPARLEETVNSLVFDEKEGFWAIACERNFVGVSDEHLAYKVSEALLNSVVFIFSCALRKSEEETDPRVMVNRWPNCRLCDAPIADEDEHYFDEIRLPGEEYPVYSQEIEAILVPHHLLSLVRCAFPKTMIIPVTSYEKTLTETPLELFCIAKDIKGKQVLGPNYVRALQAALAEFPDMMTFGVHLTRLPTVFRLDPTTSLSESCKKYNAIADRTTQRLKNPSKEQLAEIAALPGVQIVREDRRKPNHYLCFCSSSQKADIAAMMVPRTCSSALSHGV